ncbi:MAG: biotin/lipoate--protein ligase family protein [Flavobacteriaceae bacterium]
MHLPDPVLPPLLEGHPVKAPADPFTHAVEGARAGRLGGGDFVWARRVDRCQAAIVLEPEVPAARAAEMLYVAAVAFGDSFGAVAPPEIALTFDWPAAIRVNGGRVGGLSIAAAPVASDAEAPDWMVVGIDIVIREADPDPDPGLTPDVTTLEEEGCGDMDRTAMIESWSRHLLTWILTWEEDGFASVHTNWLGRLQDGDREVAVVIGDTVHRGVPAGLDENGNLLLRTGDGVRLLSTLDWMRAAAA